MESSVKMLLRCGLGARDFGRGNSVWFQQGSFADAEEIVLECADVFLSLGIRRELMASLLLVRKAAESRHLSFTTLQKVIDLLHKEERSPAPRRRKSRRRPPGISIPGGKRWT